MTNKKASDVPDTPGRSMLTLGVKDLGLPDTAVLLDVVVQSDEGILMVWFEDPMDPWTYVPSEEEDGQMTLFSPTVEE